MKIRVGLKYFVHDCRSLPTFLSFRLLLITSFHVFQSPFLGKQPLTLKVLHLLYQALSSMTKLLQSSILLYHHDNNTFPQFQEIGHLTLCLENPLLLLFVDLDMLTFKTAIPFHFTSNTTTSLMHSALAKLA